MLITAAAGGVGTAAVQLSVKLGCEVYGMVGSQEKIEFIKNLGAIEGFNYRNPDYFKKLVASTGGVDIVIEMVGGDVFRKSINLLRPFGRIVVAGFASMDVKKWNPITWIKTCRDIPRISVRKMAEKSIAVMSTHIGYLLDEDPNLLMGIYNDMRSFVTKRHIRPVISKVFPFHEATEAHRFIESRKSYGKVLLKVDV
ncbi:MAG: zinc-binding alcohol dehydrogenase family protein [Thermodesulfobacteriota bacterium]